MTKPKENIHDAIETEAALSKKDGTELAGVGRAGQNETGDHVSRETVPAKETDLSVKKRPHVNFGVLLLLAYGVVLLFYLANLSMDLMTRSAPDQVPTTAKKNVSQGTSRPERVRVGGQEAPTTADESSNKDYAIDVDTVRRLLEPHGWRVAPDNEGGVLLFPRSAVTSPSVSSSPLMEDYEPFNVDMLRSLLAPHGWRVESDGAGGVLLIPGGLKQGVPK